MKDYIYQNKLISKKQLRKLLGWSFTNYNSMQACTLADELKYLGFRYATRAGISISIEDLKVPFVKNLMLEKANEEILNSEKIYLKGKLTEVERFQKIIDTWSLTSESLKNQVIYYFNNYDPLNSVYIMAFSGARGNLSQVRQLVGMRGLMSDPSGEIMNLPIKKNFREGLTITDYLMSGYGARKGIVDTALKTANSGYLTRRLIDVAQDILIREKDCLTTHSFLIRVSKNSDITLDQTYTQILGRIINKPIFEKKSDSKKLLAKLNTQISPSLIQIFKQKEISHFYIRSPLSCSLYRAVCQKCYGWDLANENLVDIGEAVGILAGQSIGEPGTQLTMRTFHTGGIFTSEARQQIISPTNGLIQFSQFLKTVNLRTNRGEDVLVTKNSGSIILIPDDSNQNFIPIETIQNTILFPKNNQYIQKGKVIGEFINANKQIKREVKTILSYSAGEIIVPQLKSEKNILNNNKLLWLLSGELYNSPISSFVNFYPDYKLTQSSFIFRSKIINQYIGFIKKFNKRKTLYQRKIQIENSMFSLIDGKIQKLILNNKAINYLISYKNSKYLIKQKYHKQKFAELLTNSFQTLIGGKLFYDQLHLKFKNNLNNTQVYYRNNHSKMFNNKNGYKLIYDTNSLEIKVTYINKLEKQEETWLNTFFRTLIWLPEETQKVNCEENILLVNDNDFISKNFETIPGTYSKNPGLIKLNQQNNVIETITIKSGSVYRGKLYTNEFKKLYYPGEKIFSKITIDAPSVCEIIQGETTDQLLIRPIELYEFSQTKFFNNTFKNSQSLEKSLKLTYKSSLLYKSNQTIKSANSVTLVSRDLNLNNNRSFANTLTVQLCNKAQQNLLNFQFLKNPNLNNYITPKLKYKNLQSCLLTQKKQFIDRYTIILFLEALSLNSLEIVRFKINKTNIKQILLISNDHCVSIEKSKLPGKQLNNFILNSEKITGIGKIIIENKNFFTLQKGRPYFFPNCKTENYLDNDNLEYKVIPTKYTASKIKTNRLIYFNSYNMLKVIVKKKNENSVKKDSSLEKTMEFSKLFLKKNGKFYSSLIPRFFKNFTINSKNKSTNFPMLFNDCSENKQKTEKEIEAQIKRKSNRIDRPLLLQSSDMILNNFKTANPIEFTFVKFLEYPLTKSSKSVGLYSITEDYFEQEVNSVFCKNNEFIEEDSTIGLLNLEKEITGDIVQGLPRIEEILEARKKNLTRKRIPTNQKKSLLIQKTNLDPDFEFRKTGTSIKENEKINPHKLLKSYFNYYGLIKFFYCERNHEIYHSRLVPNFEASYKSFKQVQSFILNSVQSVYISQGVTINDKHLEIIIKQMTTKILITYEGNTPLLRKEVLDLYHINYINKTIKRQKKEIAYYVPLLLGITKAALNNPSFISAASFQETTRVLTRAAIEGRIDWLRGLKENIIIGHLIPAGTGSISYKNSFKK